MSDADEPYPFGPGSIIEIPPPAPSALWDAQLCYIERPFAYFTTQPLAKQWGDDWDDAPYEHNAGEPYLPHGPDEHWSIVKVAWDGPWETPADMANGNSPFSVERINSRHIAWLLPDRYSSGQPDAIHAGTTVRAFCVAILRRGGNVYLPTVLSVPPALAEAIVEGAFEERFRATSVRADERCLHGSGPPPRKLGEFKTVQSTPEQPR